MKQILIEPAAVGGGSCPGVGKSGLLKGDGSVSVRVSVCVWPAVCYLLAHAKISLIRMVEPGGTKPA